MMKYLFKKIKNSFYGFFLVFGFIGYSINTLIEQSIANTDQIESIILLQKKEIERLEEAIILLQKKEIERLEKDLEECKDKRKVDCVYRESLK